MGKTKTEKKNKKNTPVAATAIQPTGEAVDGQPTADAQPTETTAEVKVPRIKKNATTAVLDFNDPATATAWLTEFYEQGKNHPPRKGYDQHWNSEGFIHAGPADRLPNAGAVKMGIFIGDMLAKREVGGDPEAGTALDFLIGFLQNRRETLIDEQNAAILAQADAIRAKQAAAAV